jgi:hypothetical protein
MDGKLAGSIERLRVTDSYGIEWESLLRDPESDPRMASDCVVVVRAYLRILDEVKYVRSQSFCPDLGEFSRGFRVACDEILDRILRLTQNDKRVE